MDRVFLDIKIATDDSGEVSGLAWPFGSPDLVGDVIEKGAFANATMPMPMLFAHDQKEPVGVWTEAKETDEGLELKGRLLIDQVARAREIYALVKAGAVRGISVGFLSKKATPRRGGGRVISALKLLEASLVAIPMHPGAKVTSAKSAVEALRLVAVLNRASLALKPKG